MKKIIFLISCFSFLFLSAQEQQVTINIDKIAFSANDQVTITVSNVDPTLWNTGQPDNIYIWAWSFDLNGAEAGDSPTNGSWNDSNALQQLTNNGNGTYGFTFTPSSLFGTTNISKIGFLLKADNGASTGSGDKKSQNLFLNLAINELTLAAPSNYLTVANSGTLINISATTNLTSDFTLKANGASVNTANGTKNYSFDYTLTSDVDFVLEANDGSRTISEFFNARLTPSSPVPSGMLDGINLDSNDNTKATLVLYAPNKSTVHVIGNFNNWQENAIFKMNKDTARDKFWIELTGLTPNTNHMYQYLVDSTIKVADPYSTTILDEFNDSSINATTYPNLPSYPTGSTNHAVTLLRTGDPDYSWQTTNFQPPAKTDLVIYELLIRDFDELHSFDAIKARLDYIQDLGANAIEFMPVSEFDGNKSWGYNPSFHMALDKYYGTPTAFKQFIDECHNRGIAVVLDVVYNHATGQNPFYRLWNTDNGGYGGQASVDNPFFNQTATHSYSVFNDFNHQSEATKSYVERTVKYWIEEYKIDGFRWDLTKGFTQLCTSSDENCTNEFKKDRVDVLKEYADYQWAMDSDFYIIFEHLGGIDEEKHWADYRANEGKGIMLWNNLNGIYNEATMGYHVNNQSNFSNVSYSVKGFDGPSAVSYMESHDEQRLMYKNLQFGNSNGGYSVKTANTALARIQTAGAFFFTVPGPKMIWQFGELGYEVDIDFNGRTGEKPIRWEYFSNPDRKAIYDTWSRLIYLKHKEPIFNTQNFSMDLGSTNGLKSIHLTLDSATGNDIKHITVLGNFGVTQQSIDTNFQEGGIWYDLMDETGNTTINGSTTSLSLAPGEFKVFGNNPSALSVNSFENDLNIQVYPNPATTSFQINKAIEVLLIYDITGKVVKTFKGSFAKGYSFNISNLPASIYLAKVSSSIENTTNFKIVKLN
ncbi:alpha-amylase family glycosyl hydrolase [Thalassobellus suaedae]|uniref:Alpha-amylase family glycosyl hydrolase n=1 Tax=Thalassobellus suaedae TaxID=3074124 RepID=A0ABY9XZZ4_9FLAO|nr:alpha-amylase family glycosyl hydrolase [Flavobacteriaceae bacterium HL-DH10]